MAEEELGNFKIRVETVGADKVNTDLEAIRAGLRSLKESFEGANKSGESLAGIFKNLKKNSDGFNFGEKSASVPGVNHDSEKERVEREKSEGRTPKILENILGFQKKDSKDKSNVFKNIRTTLEKNALGGSSLLSNLSEKFATLGKLTEIIKGGSVVSAVAAGSSLVGMYIDDERRSIGSGTADWINKYDQSGKIRKMGLDEDTIARLSAAIAHQNYVVDESGNITTTSTDKAFSAALGEAYSLSSEMSMFRMRGRVPKWMEAMWMANIDTTDIEGASDEQLPILLAKKVSWAKRNLDKDMWRTFATEADSMPQNIFRLGVENTPRKIDEWFSSTQPSTYNSGNLKVAQDVVETIGKQQENNRYADEIKRNSDLDDAASLLIKAIDLGKGGFRAGWAADMHLLDAGRTYNVSTNQKENDTANDSETAAKLISPMLLQGIFDALEEIRRSPYDKKEERELEKFGDKLSKVSEVTRVVDDGIASSSDFSKSRTGSVSIGNIYFEISGSSNPEEVAEICANKFRELIGLETDKIQNREAFA